VELEKIRAAFDVPFATEDADALLAHDRLDAVVISTPHDQHAAQAVSALQRGLHVMVEKPLAVK
jgi:predicted dehydrogenase